MKTRDYLLGYWKDWPESRHTALHILFVASVLFLFLPVYVPVDGYSVSVIQLLLAFWRSFVSGVMLDVAAQTAQATMPWLIAEYIMAVGAVFIVYVITPPQLYKKWRHHNK